MNTTTQDAKDVYTTIAVLNDNNSRKYHNVFNIISIETSFYFKRKQKEIRNCR